MRDLMLDVTPFWMEHVSYVIVTALALVFVLIFRKYVVRLDNTFFIFDAVGIALFTVVGVEKSIAAGFPIWVNIIMGTITGAAGGMFRDIFINEVPLIFRKEIYAMACLSGGVVYYLCVWVGMNTVATQIIAAVSVILVRILSVHFRISLPSLKNIDSQTPDGNRNGDNGL